MKAKKNIKLKRIVCILSLFLLVFALGTLLCSCYDEEDENAAPSGVLTLNVYNWGEYISDGSLGSYDSNKEFERYYFEKFGQKVKVNYSTYATNEDMYYKVKSGAGSYDIIVPSDYMIEKMIAEDLLREIDVHGIENYENLDPDFLTANCAYDPERKYSVSYAYGVVGIIYNDTMVDEEDVAEQSWGLLWNEKYKGKILQFNNPRDGFATAMYYLGLDVNSTDTDDWDQALEWLKKQKPLVQSYVSDEIFNKMISGSAAIGTYYAGDYITMVDKNDALAFYYPKEGTNVFVDAMCIPKTAKNPKLAEEYINFMLSEEAAVANAIYIGYASPNKLVKENEDYIEEMGEEAVEILYGAEGVNKDYPFSPEFKAYASDDLEQYVFSLWEELKTENATELWVHITSAVIVLALAGWFSYSYFLRKERSRDYRMRDRKKAAERKAAAASDQAT